MPRSPTSPSPHVYNTWAYWQVRVVGNEAFEGQKELPQLGNVAGNPGIGGWDRTGRGGRSGVCRQA